MSRQSKLVGGRLSFEVEPLDTEYVEGRVICGTLFSEMVTKLMKACFRAWATIPETLGENVCLFVLSSLYLFSYVCVQTPLEDQFSLVILQCFFARTFCEVATDY